MFEINVVQLLKSPTGDTRDFQFDERSEELEQNTGVHGPVRGKAHLVRTQRGILVEADYQATGELECGRCLERFLAPLSGEFEEEFLPSVDIWSGERVEDDEDALRIGEDHILDLSEAIRQDILVRLPLQPLCSEACKGLCPQCGAARNREECSCQPAAPESPFQALAKLLEQDSSSSDERGRES